MTRLALKIDLERCIGCKSCEAACKTEHGLSPGEYRNRVLWLGDTTRPVLDFLTLSCQHCERPACLRACPVDPKAITKDPDTGVVRVDESRCTGCGECVTACPYGAMGYDPIDHHAVKCDLCSDRRMQGMRPACATVCPGEAITFGERDQHLADIAAEHRRVIDHDAFLLGPANIFVDRIPKPASEALANPPMVFTMDGRSRPPVVDDPERRAQLKREDVAFPFRSSREDRKADRIVAGGCNICFNCCSTNYHLRDGKVVAVTGNEDDPLWRGKVCPKSQFLLQLYNSKERLTRPLKRVGRRGEGLFEPISWEQALDEIASKLQAVKADFSPEALAIFAGTRTGTLARKGYIRLFTQLWGTPNFGDTEAFCSEAKHVAFQTTLGIAGCGNSYTPDDLGSAELYVYIGDNQAESRPVHFGMINNWRLRNRAKMIAVDPRLTVTASKADRWLPIRSGTDLALALAMAYHILEQGLHNADFCNAWVVGWQDWRDFLFANQYSPEWASSITGLAADDIRQLAADIAAANGCVIFAARGINQHTNGVQTNRAFLFVAAITGNIGRKGGAFFNFGLPVPIVANAPAARQITPSLPLIGINPTSWLDAILDQRPYPLRALITCNNPLTAWPNQKRVREAFLALDLVVHIELFKNETSAYADYVLPAATGVEKGEIGRASEDRRVVWIDRVIDPPGEAKPDGWIWIELGKRLGYDDVLKDAYKDEALFWDEMCINDPWMKGCTQKRLHSVPWRWVRTPVSDEQAEEIETFHLEGTTAFGCQDKRFPTPSGKIEFFTPALDNQFRILGLSALPEFYTDREQLIDLPYLTCAPSAGGEVRNPFTKLNTYTLPVQISPPNPRSAGRELRDKGFDTELITGRPPAPHFHSWTHYAWQAQEMWPDLYVQIHPEKAQALCIGDGDEVQVETAHGRITARAWLYPGIRKDAVFIPIGWDASQPHHPWRSVNFLTDASQRDPVSDHSNLKTFLCRLLPTQTAKPGAQKDAT